MFIPKVVTVKTHTNFVAPSRDEAVRQGNRYYHGEPCKHNHTKKQTTNGICYACHIRRDAIKRDPLTATNRMITIDRAKKEPDFDDWYYGEI